MIKSYLKFHIGVQRQNPLKSNPLFRIPVKTGKPGTALKEINSSSKRFIDD